MSSLSLYSRFRRISLRLIQHIVARFCSIPVAQVARVLISLWTWAHSPKHSSVPILISSGSILEASYQVVSHTMRRVLILHSGISRTTPGINAFRGENLQRQVWDIRNLDAPTMSSSAEALPRIVAIKNLYNRLLADKAASIAPYVGTAAVAHDMLSIVEAMGQGSLAQVSCSSG